MVIKFPKYSWDNMPKTPRKKLSEDSKKKLRLAIYVSFGIICLFWIGYGLNQYWSSSYEKLLSHNAATLTEISAEIKNLDQPISITPSKTSTTLPATVTAYESLVNQINQTKLKNTNIFSTGFYGFGDVTELNNSSYVRLESADTVLSNSIKALTATQKFIEYDPATDLQPYVNGEEPDASERLSRTQEGINQVISDVQKANIPYSNDITALLQPLSKQALKVTPDTVDEWSKDVLKAQQAIIKLIQNHQEKALDSTVSKLEQLSTEYLLLRP